MKKIVYLFCILGSPLYSVKAKIWNVGPTETYKFCSAVAVLVGDGDTVNIAAADYINDAQVQWTKNNLLIRGVGGRPRLFAGDLIANDPVNGKGIFVVKGNYCTIENIDFRDAKCLSHNGAGIRQEGSNVIIRHCRFEGNEMGILGGGTSTLPNSTYIIEYCDFLNGGSTADPGFQHNIYINHIDTLIFRYNWSRDAIAQGHELKSRANHTYILYNRISNISSMDSRNIDIPNGGTAIVMGNILEQGMNSANSNMLAYGLEGFKNPGPHNLIVCFNTFVNKKDKGSFIHIPSSGCDTLFLKNNILAGAKTGGLIIGAAATLDSSNNFITNVISEVQFVNSNTYDYRLNAQSPAVDAGVLLQKTVKGRMLLPVKSYRDTCSAEDRVFYGAPDIGAFEYENPALSQESIETPEPYRLTVFDKQLSILHLQNSAVLDAQVFSISGQKIAEYNRAASDRETDFQLDLSPNPRGYYVLHIKTVTSESVYKFFLD